MTPEQAANLVSLIIVMQHTALKANHGASYYSEWITASNAVNDYIKSITISAVDQDHLDEVTAINIRRNNMYELFTTEGCIEVCGHSSTHEIQVKPHVSGTKNGVVMELHVEDNEWIYITKTQAMKFFGLVNAPLAVNQD